MSVNEKTWPVKGNSAIGDRLELEVQVCESSLSLLSHKHFCPHVLVLASILESTRGMCEAHSFSSMICH